MHTNLPKFGRKCAGDKVFRKDDAANILHSDVVHAGNKAHVVFCERVWRAKQIGVEIYAALNG